MERYIFLKSSDSKQSYFNENTPYHFRVKLNQRLNFDGFWVVSLTEINFGKLDITHMNDPYVDVLCNLCDSSLAGEQQLPLLRRLDLRQGPYYSFAHEYNIPIKVKESPHIEVRIKASNGMSPSFLKEVTYVTLHLRRYPFID